MTVSLTSKLSYGIGQAAEGIKNNAFSLFLLFYYVQVHGLSASLAGVALFIALCFDAVSDPVVGYLSDSWRSRWGRRHPFMYASAIPLAIAFYFTFVPPDGLSQTGLFIWLTVFTVLTRGAMTLYHVPHIALGAELSDDYEERTAIVGYRTAFAIIGSLLIFASVALFFPESEDGARGQLENDNYPPFALTCALIMWITIWVSAIGTHKDIPRLPRVSPQSEPLRLNTFGILRILIGVVSETLVALHNANFRSLFLGLVVFMVMVGVNLALNFFMFTFFWELDATDLQMVLIIYPIGVFLGIPLTKYFHRRFDKKPAIVWGVAWWVSLQLLPVTLRLLGFFPDNEAATLVYLLAGIALIQGLGVSIGTVSFGSMVADIVDEQELETGRRQEGIFFAAVSFAGKATSGLGGLVAGVSLDLIDWPQGEAIRTAADVDPEVIVRLGLLFGPGVAVFGFATVWMFSLYRLDRDAHAAILVELKTRRETASA